MELYTNPFPYINSLDTCLDYNMALNSIEYFLYIDFKTYTNRYFVQFNVLTSEPDINK